MSVINVLSKEVSELIAAGEVIERPSSVIKELVENSIDSGAEHITVEIKNGGATYMRVTDDGCGMSFEDVPTAFLRHATSKISEKDDLDNIYTLGFRGEALASISAVARVEVMTKQEHEDYGTLYSIEGSRETLHDRGGCPDGTTIIIRDLFYNVPARRKFMKKDVTEANAVSQIMQKITLSHPNISFRFIRDNRTEFNSAGDGELFSAVYAIYGRDFARDLIPVEYEFGGVKVSGFTIKPLYSRNNRAFQNFFVNGRYVRSRLCSAALENAYSNLIMTGKFPACVLMVELPPAAMDVNIHPAKAEVRFTDEKTVSDAIFFAVKNALMKDGLIYEFQMKPPQDWTKKPEEPVELSQQSFFTPVEEIARKEQEAAQQAPIQQPVQSFTPPPRQPLPSEGEPDFAPEVKGLEGAADFDVPPVSHIQPEPAPFVQPEPVQQSAPTVPEEPEEEPEAVEGFRYISQQSLHQSPAPKLPEPAQPFAVKEEFPNIRVIGEAFGLYVIAESGDKLIIIDKHAAHERIIFERLRSRNCRQFSQRLLTGVKVLLTGEEFSAIENNTELLEDLGFAFDLSQRPCVVATAVPTFVMELDMEDIICEVADNLCMHKQSPQSGVLDDMLHTMACKAAIKQGDKNTPEEMLALCEQVCNDERIRHCPHGRPVMFTMSKYNLDHQFRRT